jgi:hypothetical protein
LIFMTSFLERIKVQKNCILFIVAKNRKYGGVYYILFVVEKN